MLYSFSRLKLRSCTFKELPVILAACCQVDDSSPYFDNLRRYLVPVTSEERLAEMISNFDCQIEDAIVSLKTKRATLQRSSERRFDYEIDCIKSRLFEKANKLEVP